MPRQSEAMKEYRRSKRILKLERAAVGCPIRIRIRPSQKDRSGINFSGTVQHAQFVGWRPTGRSHAAAFRVRVKSSTGQSRTFVVTTLPQQATAYGGVKE